VVFFFRIWIVFLPPTWKPVLKLQLFPSIWLWPLKDQLLLPSFVNNFVTTYLILRSNQFTLLA